MVWCFSCFAVHAGWVLLWRRASSGEYDKAGSGQTIWIMFGYSWPITEVLYVFIMSCLSFVKGPHCCWAKMIARHGQDLKQKIPCTAVSEPVRSIVLTWHGWTWHVLTLHVDKPPGLNFFGPDDVALCQLPFHRLYYCSWWTWPVSACTKPLQEEPVHQAPGPLVAGFLLLKQFWWWWFTKS